MEKVPAPRSPLHFEVNIRKSYGREESKASLRNVSLSGAFIESCSGSFLSQEKIHLTFLVGGRERTLQATVIWANSQGYGVKFIHNNNQDLQIIDDLIYFVENKRNTRRSVLDIIFKKVS
ncbi:MAG: PilZ domain-containing protein [Bdellovibrionota bacterium]